MNNQLGLSPHTLAPVIIGAPTIVVFLEATKSTYTIIDVINKTVIKFQELKDKERYQIRHYRLSNINIFHSIGHYDIVLQNKY